MRVSFSPMRRDDTLTLERTSANRLRINGELFNFNTLNNGDMLAAGVVPCEWIVGPVKMIDGELHLTLILPHGPNPSPEVAFPEPIFVTDDGPIAVPKDEGLAQRVAALEVKAVAAQLQEDAAKLEAQPVTMAKASRIAEVLIEADDPGNGMYDTYYAAEYVEEEE